MITKIISGAQTGADLGGLLAAESLGSHEREVMRTIFVFGSNLAGRHGRGAALHARKNHGAIYGKGEGLQGDSYAIPTKDGRIRTLPLDTIQTFVARFLYFADTRPDLTFEVTRIGCGLAGYTDSDIAPMFVDAPANCNLPEGWREYA